MAAGIAAAVIVAACGSGTPTLTLKPSMPPSSTPIVYSTPPSTPVVDDTIVAILEATSTISSARMTFGVALEGSSGIPARMAMSGIGEFDLGSPRRAHVTLDMSDFNSGTIEVIQAGEILYLRGPTFELPDVDGRWIRVDMASDHFLAAQITRLMSSQADPWSGLYLLRGVTAPAREVEPAMIDGTRLRHLLLRLDLDRAVERATGATRDYLVARVHELITAGVAAAFDAEVWIDEEDRIRRAVYRMAVSPLKGGGEMILDYDITDIGAVVEIDIPAGTDDVVDIEDLKLTP
jgi:hypothetical protein